MATLSLEYLIGQTPNIKSIESIMKMKGLSVAVYTYTAIETTTNAQKSTVIAIHGGPAGCHNYMLPLKLLVNEGYDVVFYDQAGCGKSSFLPDPEIQSPWLLTLEYYIDELKSIVSHCKLSNYYLYGSSWVSMNFICHLKLLIFYCIFF